MAFYTQSDGRVCLGGCQQRGGEIYVLVLGGARAFDPCSVIFYCVRDTTRQAAPFPPRKKKKKEKKSLTPEFQTGKNEEREKQGRKEEEDEQSMSEHCFQRAQNRKPEGSIGINQAADQ